MNPISAIALALAVAIGGVIAYVKLDTWWHERKLKKAFDTMISIAREAGIPDDQLKTRCDGCKRFSVGLVCPYC